MKAGAIAVLCLAAPCVAQHARVRVVPNIDMPAQVDSNSPALWKGGKLQLFNSTGNGPVRSVGADQFNLANAAGVVMIRQNPWPMWIESAWLDTNGNIFAWYHQEHHGVCPGTNLALPQIGAAISYDGGSSFYDLGAVLTSGDAMDCGSQNGFFAGGHGDFSVVLDRKKEFFYFFFTNYAGPRERQGVAVARMAYNDRYTPAGAVWKYDAGGWTEPGVGGRVTPIFPAKVKWQRANTDSFWGPSLHWNTYLESYVMLLNRSCCTSGFPQKGIYLSYGMDLADPASWTKPQKLVDDPGWYPQVLGKSAGMTDSIAGRTPRLYIYGHSHFELVFEKAAPPAQ